MNKTAYMMGYLAKVAEAPLALQSLAQGYDPSALIDPNAWKGLLGTAKQVPGAIGGLGKQVGAALGGKVMNAAQALGAKIPTEQPAKVMNTIEPPKVQPGALDTGMGRNRADLYRELGR